MNAMLMPPDNILYSSEFEWAPESGIEHAGVTQPIINYISNLYPNLFDSPHQLHQPSPPLPLAGTGDVAIGSMINPDDRFWHTSLNDTTNIFDDDHQHHDPLSVWQANALFETNFATPDGLETLGKSLSTSATNVPLGVASALDASSNPVSYSYPVESQSWLQNAQNAKPTMMARLPRNDSESSVSSTSSWLSGTPFSSANSTPSRASTGRIRSSTSSLGRYHPYSIAGNQRPLSNTAGAARGRTLSVPSPSMSTRHQLPYFNSSMMDSSDSPALNSYLACSDPFRPGFVSEISAPELSDDLEEQISPSNLADKHSIRGRSPYMPLVFGKDDSQSPRKKPDDQSQPPDLFAPLEMAQSSPPPEDMNPSDPAMIPREQKLRFDGDLYTPKWVRGQGNKREGWCGICKPGRWLVLKNSAYWYDKSFAHGVSASTGQAFPSPEKVKRTEDNPDVWAGLCVGCHEYIPLVSNKKRGTAWFRHAYKCQSQQAKVKDESKAECKPVPVNSKAHPLQNVKKPAEPKFMPSLAKAPSLYTRRFNLPSPPLGLTLPANLYEDIDPVFPITQPELLIDPCLQQSIYAHA